MAAQKLMVELTDQEKLERRRQKRQQRILQAGESRLSKITGTAYPERATPSPTPSPSASAKITSPTTINTPTNSFGTRQRRDSDDPSEDLGAPQSLENMRNQQFASMFGGVPGVPGSASDETFNPAALFGAMGGGDLNSNPEVLQQMLGAGGGQGGFNPAALLASMAGGANPMEDQQAQVVDKSVKYWNVLHLIMMVLLGFYSVYTGWQRVGSDNFGSLLYSNTSVANYPAVQVPLFWYFITFELCMQSARLFYQKGTMPPTSTLATIATQLPHPFGNIITIFLRYRLIWSCLVQDICILVFIIGLSEVIANVIS